MGGTQGQSGVYVISVLRMYSIEIATFFFMILSFLMFAWDYSVSRTVQHSPF